MDIQLILYLITLLLFILHELEEIFYFHKWFDKNGCYLTRRFPRLGKRMVRQFNHIKTNGFTIIALEETVILILLLLFTLFAIRPEIWIGVIIMLCLHWLATIIQSIILKRVIPGTITAIPGLCFSVYTLSLSTGWYPLSTYIKWGLLLFIFAMANLFAMHMFVGKFLIKGSSNSNQSLDNNS